MSSSKPTIILVPGAWHPPTAFDPLTKYLESHSYNVVPVALASVGANPPLEDFSPDVEAISKEIRKAADSGSDVILLTHSYGGVPGSDACKGLLKSDRGDGKGGLVHMIYCCSFALPAGVSLMDGLGGQNLPWFDVAPDQKTLTPATPVETFYNDIHDEKVLEELKASLKPHSYATLSSKATYPVFKDLASTYIVCTLDAAIPRDAQLGMVEGAKKLIADQGGKGSMDTVEINASHSPFVSMPKELGDAIRKIAGESV